MMPESREVVSLCSHIDGFSPGAIAAGKPIKRHPGERYFMEVGRISANVERGIVYDPMATELDWWKAPGRILTAEPAEGVKSFTDTPSSGALKIVQGTSYDPGSAAYRFHTAINECTKHASAFVRFGDSNPYSSLRQWDMDTDEAVVRRLVFEADIVHCHMNYILIGGIDKTPKGLLVRHYHGSRVDGVSYVEQRIDDLNNAVQVGARLTLLSESPRMKWLPITIPVKRYHKLREEMWRPDKEFRVAHSPTKRAIKGTEAFLAACEHLQYRGIPVKPILIEKVKHDEALVIKARCDASFDSFWLGIQGSGLEGAAMRQPVIAGDPKAKALHEEHIGYVPYTYANTQVELEETMARLATDLTYRDEEAARVYRYVLEYHDYLPVSRRYEAILAEALGRDDVYTSGSAKEVA